MQTVALGQATDVMFTVPGSGTAGHVTPPFTVWAMLPGGFKK